MRQSIAHYLWGEKAKPVWLIMATLTLLLTHLGARELWTQEHRWADIVSNMFYRHDIFHPWLNGAPYYDKPLLSYWLIKGCATLLGQLSTVSLRLPSALAGIIAIGAFYSLACRLKNREFGLLAAWMLLTTFFFLFWARTSSADMLNMAGTLCAVSWYYAKKSTPGFFNYFFFFLIIAFTALCKGLIAPAVVALVLLPDILTHNTWRAHLRPSLFLAFIPALIIYLLPFWISSHYSGTENYQENGLSLVWRENILRYFQPFDHKGPLYTYLIYLPVYLLPWTVFFIPALFDRPKQRMGVVVLLLFLFLTLSGSRRNYYILPVVPFALLMAADWIMAKGQNTLRYRLAGLTAFTAFCCFFIFFAFLQPLYYQSSSLEQFTLRLKDEAEKTHPWSQWQIILLDPESKLRFYLNLPPDTPLNEIPGDMRSTQNTALLKNAWPFLHSTPLKHPTIYITRATWKPYLHNQLGSQYRILENPPSRWRTVHDTRPIAFISNK